MATTPHIRPISWQKTIIKHRFPHSRSNLCALSQLYNLYFVASSSDVQVYRPTHPEQSLLHVATIKTPKVGDFPGYIDRYHPHCINHLVVAFLGNREILLLCCDDGDVCSWYTDQINHSIEAGYQTPKYAPWLTECVKVSAWGLAVHTEARKIAVTSNSHNVYVYEFGLSGPEPEEGGHASLPVQRYRSRRLCLPDSGHNIPCVSFCNTGDDPKGQLLVSGDINGRTMVWDIDTMILQEWFTAHYCNSFDQRQTCKCYMARDSYAHAVWGLYYLDPRSFPHKDTVIEKDVNKHVTIKVADSVTDSNKSWRIASPPPLARETAQAVPADRNLAAPTLFDSPYRSYSTDSDTDSNPRPASDSDSDSDSDDYQVPVQDLESNDDESLGPDTSDLDDSTDDESIPEQTQPLTVGIYDSSSDDNEAASLGEPISLDSPEQTQPLVVGMDDASSSDDERTQPLSVGIEDSDSSDDEPIQAQRLTVGVEDSDTSSDEDESISLGGPISLDSPGQTQTITVDIEVTVGGVEDSDTSSDEDEAVSLGEPITLDSPERTQPLILGTVDSDTDDNGQIIQTVATLADIQSVGPRSFGIRDMLFNTIASGYFPDDPWNNLRGPKREGDFIVSRACPENPHELASRFKPPPVPLLQISAELIFLDPEHCDRKTTSSSTVSIGYPMQQHIPQWEHHGTYFQTSYIESRYGNEQMIYHSLIPELGILIVGAPVGRCAVLSLHYDTTLQHQKRYGMKLECLLPFEKQELERQRPAALLMGVAVAPMQGLENSRTKVGTTWRLMLHYNDNSVLSYSIRRGDPDLLRQLEIAC